MTQLKRSQRGLTLVEILVAVTVSLLLLGGLIQLFISNKATYNMQEGMARVQENGRFAMYFLSDTARMAGYMGCLSRVSEVTNTLNSSNSAAWNLNTGIQGYEFNNTDATSTATTAYSISASEPTPPTDGTGWTPNLPSEIVGQVIPGTDVLVVRSVDDDGIQVVDNNNSARLFVSDTGSQGRKCGDDDAVSGLCIGDILVVADCSKARVFQATNVQAIGGDPVNVVHSNANLTPGNAISSWGGSSAPQEEQFGPDSAIYRTSTKFFYIGVGANGGPALFRQEATGTPQELIENVESLQILYGRDTDGDYAADSYVTANSVGTGNWDSVVSVRLSVLVRSDNNLVPATNSAVYDLAGTRLDPVDDRRHRRVFTSTIVLRNRTL